MISPAELFRRAALAGTKRALRGVPAARQMPATVTAYTANILGGDNFGRTQARVRLDGTTRDVPAAVTLGADLTPGQRVMVQFNPPHQFLVVGSIPLGSAGQCHVLHVPFTADTALDLVTLDVDNTYVVNCGWDLSLATTTTVTFPVDGTWQISASVFLAYSGTPISMGRLWVTMADPVALTNERVVQADVIPPGSTDPEITANTGTVIVFARAGWTLEVAGLNGGWTIEPDAAGDHSLLGLSIHRLCCADVYDLEEDPA